MDSIQEGSSGIIISWNSGIVRKKLKKQQNPTLTLQEQKNIHNIAESITKQLHILKVPKLYIDFLYPAYYLMEKVDTEEPIWLGDPLVYSQYNSKFLKDLKKELHTFWQSMWNYGYAAWDFELYLQPDDRVILLDFDKFGKRLLTNPSLTDPSVYMPLQIMTANNFFDHMCFPHGFTDDFPHTIMEHFLPSRISYMKIAA
uniref:Uncharacterized protein n=1 Tax=viral metagenome TaxID=1070528 RepID=A0A6C0KP71_9ZZZZ